MSNPYYTFSPQFVPGSLARAGDVNTQFQLVQNAFDAVNSAGGGGIGTDSGSVNAVVLTMTTTRTAYNNGDQYVFTPAVQNTGVTTIKIDGLATLPLVRFNGTALQAADLLVNTWYAARYNTAINSIEITSPAAYTGAAGIVSTASPTHKVGLTAAGGVSVNVLPIDATFALDTTITPTMTGNWLFNGATIGGSAAGTWSALHTFNAGLTVNAAARNVATFAQAALSFGNTVDNPTYSFLGTGAVTFGGTISAANFTGFATPTGSIGLTAVAGTATTATRSDGTAALSQTIVPTWSGKHTYTGGLAISGNAASNLSEIDISNTGASGGAWRLGDGIAVSNGTFAFYNTTNARLNGSVSGVGNWVVPAPGSGAAVTVNGAASISLGTSALIVSGSSTSGQSNGLFIAAGTNASDNVIRLQNQAQTTNFFILTGNGAGSLGPSGSLGLAWSAAGNVTVPAPSSGIAFAATGITNQYAGYFQGSGAAGTQKGLTAVTTTQNAADKIFNVNNNISNLCDIFGDGHGDIGPNLSWTAGGNWTIAVPTSGISAVINGLNTSYVLQLASTSAANVLGFGWNVGNTSNAWNVFSQGNDPLSVGTNGTQSLFLVTNGTTRVNVNGNGAISVSAPSVGTALSVTGLANANTALVQGSSTSGQSFGLRVQAGTTSADNGFIVTNPAGSVNYFEVRGDGVVLGNDGTNLFELGYKDAPQNTQTTSYTLALSDRGKSIVMNGTSLTLTIPANASIAFPPGATIVGVNKNATALTVAITTDTLVLAGTATTGSRSVATNGLFTLYKSLTGEWLISGSGVT